METHINYITKLAFLELRRLSHIRPYIDVESAKTLASAFVLSRLDYCNSLFAGLPENKLDKLQRVQNGAARLILKKRKYERVTPLLKQLHWLPVRARIEYKLALLCFKSKHAQSPGYINDLVSPHRSLRSLRSSSSDTLAIPKTKLKNFGDRAFSFSGPTAWNNLPNNIKGCKSLTTFRSQLKTFLFRKYLE